MNTTPIFDIPSLVGKSVDEVKAILGEPLIGGTVVDEPASSPTGESMMIWTKGEYGLMANFRQTTGVITNFLLTPKNPQPGNPYSFRDAQRQDFLVLGTLNENDSRYQVEYVTGDIKPGYFAGVIVTPTA